MHIFWEYSLASNVHPEICFQNAIRNVFNLTIPRRSRSSPLTNSLNVLPFDIFIFSTGSDGGHTENVPGFRANSANNYFDMIFAKRHLIYSILLAAANQETSPSFIVTLNSITNSLRSSKINHASVNSISRLPMRIHFNFI